MAAVGAHRTLAVASGKGGVGKTTVAVGLALALRQRGPAVGLLDADLYGPDVPRMLGLTRTSEARHLTLWSGTDSRQRPRPVERFGLKVWSSQFLVGEGQALAVQSSLAGLLLDRSLGTVDWGDLDWLIVDLPPGTADLQQQLAGRLGLSGAVLVVTPQDVAHLDAKKVHSMLQRAGVRIVGGVENMAPLACPCCGTSIELFPSTPESRSIWGLGVPQLAQIPFSSAIGQAAEAGQPAGAPGSASSEVFTELAGAIVAAFESDTQ